MQAPINHQQLLQQPAQAPQPLRNGWAEVQYLFAGRDLENEGVPPSSRYISWSNWMLKKAGLVSVSALKLSTRVVVAAPIVGSSFIVGSTSAILTAASANFTATAVSAVALTLGKGSIGVSLTAASALLGASVTVWVALVGAGSTVALAYGARKAIEYISFRSLETRVISETTTPASFDNICKRLHLLVPKFHLNQDKLLENRELSEMEVSHNVQYFQAMAELGAFFKKKHAIYLAKGGRPTAFKDFLKYSKWLRYPAYALTNPQRILGFCFEDFDRQHAQVQRELFQDYVDNGSLPAILDLPKTILGEDSSWDQFVMDVLNSAGLSADDYARGLSAFDGLHPIQP
jgi:hypothetical protein